MVLSLDLTYLVLVDTTVNVVWGSHTWSLSNARAPAVYFSNHLRGARSFRRPAHCVVQEPGAIKSAVSAELDVGAIKFAAWMSSTWARSLRLWAVMVSACAGTARRRRAFRRPWASVYALGPHVGHS